MNTAINSLPAHDPAAARSEAAAAASLNTATARAAPLTVGQFAEDTAELFARLNLNLDPAQYSLNGPPARCRDAKGTDYLLLNLTDKAGANKIYIAFGKSTTSADGTTRWSSSGNITILADKLPLYCAKKGLENPWPRQTS